MQVRSASIILQTTHLVALALLHIPQADFMGPGGHIDQRRAQRGVLQAQPGRRAQRGRERLYGVTLRSNIAQIVVRTGLRQVSTGHAMRCSASHAYRLPELRRLKKEDAFGGCLRISGLAA